MAGNKAMRRALSTNQVARLTAGAPPTTIDENVWVTNSVASEMLRRNRNNRQVSWPYVTKLANEMLSGAFTYSAQAIILDEHSNILTGQHRLWAVIESGVPGVWMKITRGVPASAANTIDRGRPQTARDLATRKTKKKHSVAEASVVRAMLAAQGTLRPTPDQLAACMVKEAEKLQALLQQTTGKKKTHAELMVLAALCLQYNLHAALLHVLCIESYCHALERALIPQTPRGCWGKGAAFTLAMQHAMNIVSKETGRQT